MKAIIKNRTNLSLWFTLIMVMVAVSVQAQNKARLSVDYCKIVNKASFLKIGVKFKGDDGYEPATKLPLNVYKEITEDSLVLAGTTITNMKGEAKFIIELPKNETDTVVEHSYVVKIEDNENFKDADKSVSFIDAKLSAEAIVKDSVNYITAKLTDALGEPIKGEKLEVKIKRLFAPLKIGESYYKTDKKGTILVPFEEPLPGVDGNLTFEIMMDSKEYGLVSVEFVAPIGTPIVDQSTFDQRTMWSPPTKTPLFLWIFPNLIIIGIWLVIAMLGRNLFKIYKS